MGYADKQAVSADPITVQAELGEILSLLEECDEVLDSLYGTDSSKIEESPMRSVKSACSATRTMALTLVKRLRELRGQLGQFS